MVIINLFILNLFSIILSTPSSLAPSGHIVFRRGFRGGIGLIRAAAADDSHGAPRLVGGWGRFGCWSKCCVAVQAPTSHPKARWRTCRAQGGKHEGGTMIGYHFALPPNMRRFPVLFQYYPHCPRMSATLSVEHFFGACILELSGQSEHESSDLLPLPT